MVSPVRCMELVIPGRTVFLKISLVLHSKGVVSLLIQETTRPPYHRIYERWGERRVG